MALKPTRRPPKQSEEDDSALFRLSKADRKKLNMDAWEPSLLRKLLAAQNRLRTRN